MTQPSMPPGADPVRSPDGPPKVTIFGAGISGLTVAHELIERGFKVQIVEAAESPLEEYACQIGGMAANQLGRVKADRFDIVRLLQLGVIPGELLTERATDGGIVTPRPENDDGIAASERLAGAGPTEIAVPLESEEDKVILSAARALPMQPVQRRFALTHRVRFKKDSANEAWLDYSDDHGRTNREKIVEVLLILRSAYQQYKNDWDLIAKRLGVKTTSDSIELDILQVYIIGFTDADGLPEENRRRSTEWAKLVRSELLRLNADLRGAEQVPNLAPRLSVSGRGAEELLGNQIVAENRERSNRVEFRIVGQRIPGEHGYRFFPGFYRHLFDTMKRTPVFDHHGDLTPETAFDQLVPTPDPSIGFGGGMVPLKLTRFTSLADLRKTLKTFKERAKFTDKDLLRLQAYFLKYLTSCTDRRVKEAEDVSFWDYIGADRVRYSHAAENFLEATPQALVAMSARETDARSQYNILIQLLVQNPLEPFMSDMTLNGSTSEAWLGHWKNYLKRKGVRFFTGRLSKLKLNEAHTEFLADVSGPLSITGQAQAPIPEIPDDDFEQKDFSCDNSDFFVMALPFEEASRQIWEAYAVAQAHGKAEHFAGSFSPFQQMLAFDVHTGRRTPAGVAVERERDTQFGRPTNRSDPLRDISGIQYFMPNNYRFSDGHVYYPDSPWALSSISQLAFWRERIEPIGKYIGQNSFDIGNWYKPFAAKDVSTAEGTTAWNSTRQELAEMTYEQALAAMEKDRAKFIDLPQYHHLDQGIKFVIGPQRKGDFIETKAAFRGNGVIEIVDFIFGKTYEVELVGPDGKRIVASYKADVPGSDRHKVRDAIGERINAAPDRVALAVPDDAEHLRAHLLLSPIVATTKAVIRITGPSAKLFTLYLDGNILTTGGVDKPHAARNELVRKIRESGRPYHVETPDERTITIHSSTPPTRRDAGVLSVAVANADNHIELLGSPRLTVCLRAPVAPGEGALAKIPVEGLERALVMENANPYIINVPGQWRHRPGSFEGLIWYASENDSLMRRWVPAGTFMTTNTRITTMEAANESGRHAVNAILHKILVPPAKGEPPLFNRQGKLIGDFCKIWDPEKYELPDLGALKELDEALLREGLPHVFDILRVIELIEAMPENTCMADAVERIRGLVERQLASTTTASLLGLSALERALRMQCDALREIFSGDGFHAAI